MEGASIAPLIPLPVILPPGVVARSRSGPVRPSLFSVKSAHPRGVSLRLAASRSPAISCQATKPVTGATKPATGDKRIFSVGYDAAGYHALQSSIDVAKDNENKTIETEHLLISLLKDEDGLASRIFKKAGVNVFKLQAAAYAFIKDKPKGWSWFERTFILRDIAGTLLGEEIESLLHRAWDFKHEFGDPLVTIEHMLLGFANDKRFGRKLFLDSEISLLALKSAIKSLRGQMGVDAKDKYESELESIEKDLTALARAGKLDPVIGRDDEIVRCIETLSRRSKNMPLLIGEPGVGKTAISEGLAQRIVQGDVPQALKNHKLISLDIGALSAGEKQQGKFRDRLRKVMKQAAENDGQTIIFIDDIHNLVGAGNLVKPLLCQGGFCCIGATTYDQYRNYIEKDAALERLFHPIYVDHPTVEGTISILRGLRERYELHHGVRISDKALVEAAILSDRYVSGRFFPDKAIDVVDAAAVKLKMETSSKETVLDEINNSVAKLEVERCSLTNDTNKTSKFKLGCIEAEMSHLKERQSELTAQWEKEKVLMTRIDFYKEEIGRISLEIQQAERGDDFNQATKPMRESLSKLQCQLQDAEKDLNEQSSVLREVTVSHIAKVVTSMTGIPLTKLQQPEREKLLFLEEELRKRVVGQDPAVSSVAEALQRWRAGLSDRNRPIASLMFMGPSGVGKTELAKVLASYMFNTEEALVRIDMSEFMEQHSVSKLIGAPPGFAGYEEGGQLTEKIRRRPFAVVLLDEIEKAHSNVFHILHQILDDGRVTDSSGRTISFKSTIIIMTSNAGSQYISDADDSEILEQRLLDAATSKFSSEFMNRLDECIIFQPLDFDQIKTIVKLQLERVQNRLLSQNIRVQVAESAVDHLGRLGYNPSSGARMVKKVIQKKVENALAKAILMGDFGDGDTVLVDMETISDHQLLGDFGDGDSVLADMETISDHQLPQQKLILRKVIADSLS